MPWTSSTRKQGLPPDWGRLRTQVLERDCYRCQIGTPGKCTDKATEVDHIGDNSVHAPDNLRAVCTGCHAQRSAQQGRAAQLARAARGKRAAVSHPGFTSG